MKWKKRYSPPRGGMITVGETDYPYMDILKMSELADAHNADCDTYEARIAELDAELARVKAESLRVVPVGEPCEYGMWLEQQSSTAFLLDDEVDVHVTINRYQSANGGPSAPIEGDTIVQPVRLERWEDGNE